MNFETELKKGNFIISECSQCKKIVWPPSDCCNQCLGTTVWRKSSGIGKIIEFSKKEKMYFCVVEIENSIKIIAELGSGEPKVGAKVSIVDCGIVDKNYFFKIRM